MLKGLLAFLLAATFATHAATSERALIDNQTQPISTASFVSVDKVVSHGLELAGGNRAAGGETALHRHDVPCQDHCGFFASSPLPAGQLTAEPPADVRDQTNQLPR
jgi:hypothetical protein